MPDFSLDLPETTPEEGRARAAPGPRQPQFDPTLDKKVLVELKGTPAHRLVVIGDSLSHGFQSGTVFNVDNTYAVIIAHEPRSFTDFRFQRYPGTGGLALNIELLLRTLEERFGSETNLWEMPVAQFVARSFMDDVEDYWERGPGRDTPLLSACSHNLSVYGWDLRGELSKAARICEETINAPNADLFLQVVKNNSDRAALGDEQDGGTDFGIETLVVSLGANNALRTATDLRVTWNNREFADASTACFRSRPGMTGPQSLTECRRRGPASVTAESSSISTSPNPAISPGPARDSPRFDVAIREPQPDSHVIGQFTGRRHGLLRRSWKGLGRGCRAHCYTRGERSQAGDPTEYSGPLHASRESRIFGGYDFREEMKCLPSMSYTHERCTTGSVTLPAGYRRFRSRSGMSAA